MSDGMSDSRPYDTKRIDLTEVNGIKLARSLPAWIYSFRDGEVAECPHLDVEVTLSRWALVPATTPSGEAAVGFVPNEGSIEKKLLDAMEQRLKTKRFSRYVRKT